METRRTDGRRVLLAATLIAAAFFLLKAPVATGQEATVHIELSSAEAPTAGEPFTLSLIVDGVTNLGAFQFDLTFDPGVLAVQDVQGGDFLGSSGRQVECLPPRKDVGLIGLTCVTFGATPDGPTGSGELATITFEPLAAGSSSLRFSRLTLTDPPANPMPARAQNAVVTMGSTGATVAEEQPTPTPTTPPSPPDGDGTPQSTGQPDADTTDTNDGGIAWALWGPLIGVGIAAVALAAMAALWWARRTRAT